MSSASHCAPSGGSFANPGGGEAKVFASSPAGRAWTSAAGTLDGFTCLTADFGRSADGADPLVALGGASGRVCVLQASAAAEAAAAAGAGEGSAGAAAAGGGAPAAPVGGMSRSASAPRPDRGSDFHRRSSHARSRTMRLEPLEGKAPSLELPPLEGATARQSAGDKAGAPAQELQAAPQAPPASLLSRRRPSKVAFRLDAVDACEEAAQKDCPSSKCLARRMWSDHRPATMAEHGIFVLF
ncbi:unnamed protein product [Prorocentrum cordatum]|uniref:Uncharacterized protein n=1 Tax=Prorocentrum cordatum TaxID=2364126 RepID=A0ABN9SMW4_9DINO|nr:unnamed protein product [Polarella glacialis]